MISCKPPQKTTKITYLLITFGSAATYKKSLSPATTYRRLTEFPRSFCACNALTIKHGDLGAATLLEDKLEQLLPLLLGQQPWAPSCSRVLPALTWICAASGQHRVHSSEVGALAVLLADCSGDVLSLGACRPKRTDCATSKCVQASRAPHGNRSLLQATQSYSYRSSLSKSEREMSAEQSCSH